MIETKPCAACGKKMIKFFMLPPSGAPRPFEKHDSRSKIIWAWLCVCGNEEEGGIEEIFANVREFVKHWNDAQKDSDLIKEVSP